MGNVTRTIGSRNNMAIIQFQKGEAMAEVVEGLFTYGLHDPTDDGLAQTFRQRFRDKCLKMNDIFKDHPEHDTTFYVDMLEGNMWDELAGRFFIRTKINKTVEEVLKEMKESRDNHKQFSAKFVLTVAWNGRKIDKTIDIDCMI